MLTITIVLLSVIGTLVGLAIIGGIIVRSRHSTMKDFYDNL